MESYLDEGVERLAAGALQLRVPNGRMLMQRLQNGSEKVPKATMINMDPQGCQKQPKGYQHTIQIDVEQQKRKRAEKGETRAPSFEAMPCENDRKSIRTDIQTNDFERT